ncbi:MAG: undecaprenyldiphospho-muramoylpentapeptide beta-N-acetylglucosaminyltransferase [Clostridia bacterium]|nr:undecaprenyldiphospho-muramoylpentapeptide beta-N-acetylglucosaminyltransferase [Clostridia bacterium]
MKYLISGGGTGGHVNPGLAIAKEIKKHEPDAEILFVGTRNGLESKLIPREGFNIEFIEVSGFRRKLSLDTLKTVGRLLKSFGAIGKIIKEFKPDAVIGTGGYVCGPVVFSAALKKIPTLIHEQNAFPGVTNKILSHYVDTVAISFEEARAKFKGKARISLTGNPVRSELLNLDRERARERLKLTNNKPLVAIMGGSLGAEHINQCVITLVNEHQDEMNFNLIHSTGMKHHEKVMKEIKVPVKPEIRIEPYLFNMDEVFAAADLVVGRGGAITVSELTAVGVPSVIVPSPYVAENHQEHNARALERKGAAVVILQDQLTPDILLGQIQKLISNKDLRSKMAQDAKKMGIRNAAESLYGLLKDTMRTKSSKAW